MKFLKFVILAIAITNIFTLERTKKSGSKATTLRSEARAQYSRGEEDTQIAINGGDWGAKGKIYLNEIDGPSSYPHRRGIVFNTNFGRNNFVKYVSGSNTFYYLPCRNLNTAVCQAWGTNRMIVSDGTTTYDFWLNMWESECKTVVNYYNINCSNRKDELRRAATNFATYGNDYVSNMKTYDLLANGKQSLDTQLADSKKQLTDTNAEITKFTGLSAQTGKSIAAEEVVLSNLSQTATALQANIDSNSDQVTQITAAVQNLVTNGSIKSDQKNKYSSLANTALTTFTSLLETLKAEVPAEAASLTSTVDKLKALDIETLKILINAVLPN